MTERYTLWPYGYRSYGPLHSYRAVSVMRMSDGETVVAFPYALSPDRCAWLRACQFGDAMVGNPVDQYIAAELARVESIAR